MQSQTSDASQLRRGVLVMAVAAVLVGWGNERNTLGESTNKSTAGEESGNLALRAVIAVPGNPLTAYDISWVDQATQTYYLADRSNAGLDIYNARSNTFIVRVPGFVGVDPRGNDFSGPNGVLVIHSQNQAWVGDGPGPMVNSSVKVVDLSTNPPHVIDTIHTGGSRRSDEMAYDPTDHILAVVNNADDPPFLTLISTREPRHVIRRVTFDAALGAPFGVTSFSNGVEQPVWNPRTRRFYVSIPELNGVAEEGAIAVINPRSGQLTQLFRVNNCAPGGLALGPDQQLLIGCTDPSRTVVMEAEDGEIVREILQVGGSDEVWFNPGDGHYYLAARNNPGGPVLGVIDAETNEFTTSVTTAYNAHSVAVNERNNHIFVPLTPPRAGHPEDPNRCVDLGGPSFAGHGCIGVYWRSEDQSED
jgi:hypothetical protein